MWEREWVPLAINQISNSNSAQTNLSTSTLIPFFSTSLKSLYFQRLLHLAAILFCHISAKDEFFYSIPEFQNVCIFHKTLFIAKNNRLRMTDEEWGVTRSVLNCSILVPGCEICCNLSGSLLQSCQKAANTLQKRCTMVDGIKTTKIDYKQKCNS